MKIPFHKIQFDKKSLASIKSALDLNSISGNGFFTKKCTTLLSDYFGIHSLLTNSCTSSLELISLLIEITPGDEIIMPSFTFVSTANAFVIRGATPVFVDVRADTLNIDESLIEAAITPKTKAIVVVHYAGVSAELNIIRQLCKKHNLFLIEDAAQAFLSKYYDQYLGTIGDFGAFSFHDTKNITCGEGGLAIINKKDYLARSQLIWEKGTNRSKFLKGEIDKYSWVDIGSSFPMSELTAAFLYSQFLNMEKITSERMKVFNYYNLIINQVNMDIAIPFIPNGCYPNGHIYYILFESKIVRDKVMKHMLNLGIQTLSHYTPLHNSIGGKKFGKTSGSFDQTLRASDCLLRLPIWPGLSHAQQDYIIDSLRKF